MRVLKEKRFSLGGIKEQSHKRIRRNDEENGAAGGDTREMKNARKAFAKSVTLLFFFLFLFPFLFFTRQIYLSGEKSVRKTVRGYEKWKLDAGKSPVDVNANRLRKGDRDLSRCAIRSARVHASGGNAF